MKSFKEFLKEALVYRVDPVPRPVKDSWAHQRYGIMKNNAGSGPLDSIKDKSEIDRETKETFATPNRPNMFYGALPRKGNNGSPVRGAAVYDENKLFGTGRRRTQYKGEIHMTQEDFDNIPEKVRISSARSRGFSRKPYNDKGEVTSNKAIRGVRSRIVNTRQHLQRQYNIVIHPNHQSIRDHIDKIQKEQPHLSVLNQL